jgi:hypothetical protein
MSGILPKAPKPQAPSVPPPTPQVDDAVARMNDQDKVSRRQGRKSTILTSDNGLPDLGSTTVTGQ